MKLHTYSKSFRAFLYFLPALLFCVLAGCNNQSREEEAGESVSGSEYDSTEQKPSPYSGRLYSSGLSRQEAERLGLSGSVYQLNGKDSYFFSGPDTLEDYMGRCLGLQATEKWPPSSEVINEQYTYHRGALEVSALTLLPPCQCNSSGLADGQQALPAKELETFRGTLHRQKRPAPDIAYDYALRLEKPYVDDNHPIEGRKKIKELPLFVGQAADIIKIEGAIAAGKRISLEGARVQGYAESTALRVENIAELQ